jgi:hypothetical protein
MPNSINSKSMWISWLWKTDFSRNKKLDNSTLIVTPSIGNILKRNIRKWNSNVQRKMQIDGNLHPVNNKRIPRKGRWIATSFQ